MRFAVVCVLLCSLAVLATGLSREYDKCIQLPNSANIDFRLYYSVEGASIAFALYGNFSGWMAVGISTDGSMTSSGDGSDVMLGYVNDDECSEGCLNDYWVTSKSGSPPVKLDTSVEGTSDVTLVAGGEDDGITTIEWSRLLDTGDNVTDRVIDPNSEISLIYACNIGTVPSSTSSFVQHSDGTNHNYAITLATQTSTCTAPTPDGDDGEDGDDGDDGDDGKEDGGDATVLSSLLSLVTSTMIEVMAPWLLAAIIRLI
ncbi:formyltetrahydrofolate dehydrogenase [Balamuthia mandrillaris]